MNKAVFFDRDGVINEDYGYVGQIESFDFIAGVPEALHYLKSLGYLLVLVTNQSGVARGIYTEADFFKVTCFMQNSLSLYDACFDGIYFCPHHPKAQIEAYRVECECRKPKSGMFFKAASDLDISLEESLMFGDHASDLLAAENAGIKDLYLLGNHIASEKDKVKSVKGYFSTLAEYVKNVKNENK